MAEKSDQELLGALAGQVLPPASKLLGLRLVELDSEARRVVVDFDGKPEFCNPMGSVQGGFVTAMLDEAMAIAGVTANRFTHFVPTLEIKTSFLEPAKPGRLRAEAWVVRLGRSIAFLEGRLSDADGVLVATASATARLMPMNKADRGASQG
ncbi:MAG: PaaI family thioesterase [Minwuiales bacterium]|nr:PaaI family thioesterase [Minwuiales bacterium]